MERARGPDTRVIGERGRRVGKATEGSVPPEGAGRRLWKRVKHEVRSLVPAWIFFLLSLALLRLTQIAVLREQGVDTLPPSQILVGSLIVAKALLTVDVLLRRFRRLDDQPILVASLYRTAAYAVLVFLFQYFETLFELRREGLGAASREFVHRWSDLQFWVIQVWVVVLLFVFSATRTLAQKLGPREFRRLLVGR